MCKDHYNESSGILEIVQYIKNDGESFSDMHRDMLELFTDETNENTHTDRSSSLEQASSGTNECLSWDSYFMNIAILASKRSKDSTQVGAVVVLDNKVVGMGYNGFPAGIDESKLPTARAGDLSNTKYAYTIHAEQNAILNTIKSDISGASVYVTLFPCCRCVAFLMQCHIKEIIYLDDKHHDDDEYVAARKLLSLSNISVKKFNGTILVN